MSEIPPSGPYQQQPGYSNYPRVVGQGSPGNPNGRPPGIYFDFIGEAWRLIQPNLGTWVLSILIVGLISAAISLPFSFFGRWVAYGTFFPTNPLVLGPYLESTAIQLIPNYFTAILTGSLLYMGVKQARGEIIGVGDVFIGFSCALPMMAAAMLTGLIVTLGLCLIVPGIYLIGALAFVHILIIDKNLGPIDAIKLSYTTLKRDAWGMFALLFVAGLVYLLGLCLCCVGALFTAPVVFVTIGLTYNTYFPLSTSGEPGSWQIGVEPPH